MNTDLPSDGADDEEEWFLSWLTRAQGDKYLTHAMGQQRSIAREM
jgi:hypothetical protein